VVVTIVCLAVVAVLVLAVQALVRTLRELRRTVDELRSATLPMVDDLHATVGKAGAELDRVDGVIDRAERITATMDVAGRLTYKAMAPPLIKTLALVRGVAGARYRLATPKSGRSQKSREALGGPRRRRRRQIQARSARR